MMRRLRAACGSVRRSRHRRCIGAPPGPHQGLPRTRRRCRRLRDAREPGRPADRRPRSRSSSKARTSRERHDPRVQAKCPLPPLSRPRGRPLDEQDARRLRPEPGRRATDGSRGLPHHRRRRRELRSHAASGVAERYAFRHGRGRNWLSATHGMARGSAGRSLRSAAYRRDGASAQPAATGVGASRPILVVSRRHTRCTFAGPRRHKACRTRNCPVAAARRRIDVVRARVPG